MIMEMRKVEFVKKNKQSTIIFWKLTILVFESQHLQGVRYIFLGKEVGMNLKLHTWGEYSIVFNKFFKTEI